MRSIMGGVVAAALLVGVSTQALAADLTIWWNKSYYPEEDQQFDKIVAQFEKEKGLDVDYSLYTNEDVPRKVLAALTAGEPPDLSYGFLFDLQHTSRWAYEDVLADVSDVVGEIEDNLLPSAMQAVQLHERQDRPALDLRHAGGAADRAHPCLEGHGRAGRPQPRRRAQDLERVLGLVVQDRPAGGPQGHRQPAEVRHRPRR